MDTVRLVYYCDRKLTAENSPFRVFAMNDFGFPQSMLIGEEFAVLYGCYFPTITYCERPLGRGGSGMSFELVVEFSVPKLLYQNNLQEVSENELDEVAKVLSDRMRAMGIDWVSPDDVKKMYVRRVDVCKNIIFDSKTAAKDAVRSINTADLRKTFDFDNHEYGNGGYSVFWSNKNERISFYDKGEDLRRAKISSKKALDEDAYYEGGFSGCWKKDCVLRFEIKMRQKGTIVRRMKSVGLNIPEEWDFQHLFKEEIWRALLLGRFNEVYASIPKIPLDSDTTDKLLANIVAEESGSRGGAARSLERLGMLCALRDGISYKEISTMFEDAFGTHIRRKLKNIREPPDSRQLKNLIQIKKNIENFRPITSVTALELA